MRLHFHFNFTVQFKSPYSLSSNFIFSISNITISFWKLILRVTRKFYFRLIWGSEIKIGQVDAKSESENQRIFNNNNNNVSFCYLSDTEYLFEWFKRLDCPQKNKKGFFRT